MISALGDIDVLLLPVGGKYTLPAGSAVEFVRQLEPRIVIPMHFMVTGLKVDIAGAEQFLHQLGGSVQRARQLNITKAALPEEGPLVYVLEPTAVSTPAA